MKYRRLGREGHPISGGKLMATVRYFVTDVDKAVAFYSKQLEFTVQQQFGPNMAILRRGDLTLWLAGRMPRRRAPCRTGASRSRAAGTAS
jgi:hypothetical protein